MPRYRVMGVATYFTYQEVDEGCADDAEERGYEILHSEHTDADEWEIEVEEISEEGE